MSAFESMRDYFERLAIRRVLQRTLGSRMGEDAAPSLAKDLYWAVIHGHQRPDARVLVEHMRLNRIRREVEALCAQVSASPDRRTR